MDTTTQMETLNVTVKKEHRLDNQQPSPGNRGRFNDQGLSRTCRVTGKRETSEMMKIWSDLYGNVQQGSQPGQRVTTFVEHIDYLGGFGLCHTLAMGHAQARIVKWESLA